MRKLIAIAAVVFSITVASHAQADSRDGDRGNRVGHVERTENHTERSNHKERGNHTERAGHTDRARSAATPTASASSSQTSARPRR
jgi:Ni/Co efflux regulator RcnB